jgi:TonB family protein
MKEDTVTFTEEVFFMVERMPTFNGGDIYTEFNKYMSSNLSYPPYAYFKGIQGRVIVQFMVDTAGNVRNPVIIRSSHTDLNLEALRVISESPKWQPGYQFNVPVNVLFTYPVNFTFDRSDALEIGPSVVPPKNKRRRKR